MLEKKGGQMPPVHPPGYAPAWSGRKNDGGQELPPLSRIWWHHQWEFAADQHLCQESAHTQSTSCCRRESPCGMEGRILGDRVCLSSSWRGAGCFREDSGILEKKLTAADVYQPPPSTVWAPTVSAVLSPWKCWPPHQPDLTQSTPFQREPDRVLPTPDPDGY